MASTRERSERDLHEAVARAEPHDDQLTGVVGFFNRRVRNRILARVAAAGVSGRELLEIGCGEGHMFDGTGVQPVQVDVSMTRLARAAALGRGRMLLCADAYDLPFPAQSFRMVLLAAVLEHTREPGRILAETARVLKPGGRVVMVVPNDVTMSAGRLLLRKFPVRYPDHVTFTTPRRMRRWIEGAGLTVADGFSLPVRALPFAVNLYYFVEARKQV